MIRRSYVVGVPLTVTVNHDGRIRLDVDLSEVDIEMDPIDEVDADTFAADVAAVVGAADQVGNNVTVMLP